MFYWLTFFALLLAAIVLVQSLRAEKRAHQNRLEAIRKQIEANEKKKFQESLEKRQKNNQAETDSNKIISEKNID